MHSKQKITLLSLWSLLVIGGCVPAGENTPKNNGFTFNKPGGAPIVATRATSMTLVSPTSSPNFDSTPTYLLGGVVSGETVKIYSNSTCTGELGSAVATGTTVTITTSTLGIGTQNFYTKTSNSIGETACSGLMASYQYLGIAPTIPSSVTLQTPATSPNTDSTPTFTLSGVVAGETIKLYTNSSCGTEVGSVLAAGSTALVTSSALAPGSYNFYVKVTNTAGTSMCSSALATYNYLGVLPTEGSSINLIEPTSSPNYVAAPTLIVYGVANGDTVKVYTDAGCTVQVASALATTTSVTMTTSALAAGTHNFYTKSTNIIGSSACSSSLLTYQYLGPAPTVQVSWTANREAAVNRAGGGYRVYYSKTSNFNIESASYVNVPYVSGASAPTSANITNLQVGTYYFKIVAYSNLNKAGSTGGSTSAPSTQFSVSLP